MVIVRLLQCITSLAFVLTLVSLFVWGLSRLVRINKRKLSPTLWLYVALIASLNMPSDAIFGLWSAFGLDIIVASFALVMAYRARPIRLTL